MDDVLRDLPPGDADRLRDVPCLRGASRVSQLGGGITNRNYQATTSAGEVVVRLSDPQSSDLAIDRHHEYLNSVAAAASGAAPPVVDYVEGAGVLVVAWVQGLTLTDADVAAPGNLPRIADACRLLHGGPAFAGVFDMFDIQARYLSLVRRRGFRLPAGYLDFQSQVDRIQAALAVDPEPRVPCNNDLLPANIIDDGKRLWLIDYEYSGMNEASFEIGNIWSESALPVDLLEPLVTAYWGRESASKVARARLWSIMSKYGWTSWASIQDGQSSLDFDYWAWGMEKYDRAVAELDDPGFAGLLRAAATPD